MRAAPTTRPLANISSPAPAVPPRSANCNAPEPANARIQRVQSDPRLATPLRDLLNSLTRVAGYAESLSLDDKLAPAQQVYARSIIAACGQLNQAVIARLALLENRSAANTGSGFVRERSWSAQRSAFRDVG